VLEVQGIYHAVWNPLSQGSELPDWKMPRLIEVAADVFHPQFDFWVADEMFHAVRLHKLHTFRMTTRHPQRMRQYLQNARNLAHRSGTEYAPPPNLWLGVSVSNQAEFDQAMELLPDCIAKVRYLHIMPHCEELNAAALASHGYNGVDWVYMPESCDSKVLATVGLGALFGRIPFCNQLRNQQVGMNWPRGWKAPQWTREDAIAAGEEWEEIDWDDAAF
jgi:hypothetical protein